ncbi:MAG: cation:proton antiporter [Pseudomonadota bacterium]
MLIIIATLIIALLLQTTRLGRRAAEAPGLCLAIGISAALFVSAFSEGGIRDQVASSLAAMGLAALGFASAAQLRVSRLSRYCPSSFRLTFGGAPIYFIACSLAALVMLPGFSLTAALLLGATLTLNGAAFDRKAVINAPAPATIKAAVRYESAAIIALGLPLALLCLACATAPGPNEPTSGPIMRKSLDTLIGFSAGGVVGLVAAHLAALYRRRTMQRKSIDTGLALMAGAAAFTFGPMVGGEPIVAATAAGLLWGEQTNAASPTRLRIRQFAEQSVTPLAYLGFGCLVAPRLFQADLLSIVFAIAAVTILRVGPRLIVLNTPSLPKESQAFLAWFGGAPGAASALFTIYLIGQPALTNPDGVLTVASLAVVGGVISARLTSRPLVNAYLRRNAVAKRRRAYAI